MPKLPDVEVLKNYCRQNILDKQIDSLFADMENICVFQQTKGSWCCISA